MIVIEADYSMNISPSLRKKYRFGAEVVIREQNGMADSLILTFAPPLLFCSGNFCGKAWRTSGRHKKFQ